MSRSFLSYSLTDQPSTTTKSFFFFPPPGASAEHVAFAGHNNGLDFGIRDQLRELLTSSAADQIFGERMVVGTFHFQGKLLFKGQTFFVGKMDSKWIVICNLLYYIMKKQHSARFFHRLEISGLNGMDLVTLKSSMLGWVDWHFTNLIEKRIVISPKKVGFQPQQYPHCWLFQSKKSLKFGQLQGANKSNKDLRPKYSLISLWLCFSFINLTSPVKHGKNSIHTTQTILGFQLQ